MAITKIPNDLIDLNQTGNFSGIRLPEGTTADRTESFTTDYLVVGGGGSGSLQGAGGAGGLRTSYNNSTTTTNSLAFPSGKTAIATYMLDNNATDISGNYDGAQNSITYNTGQYGGAAVFNGSSSKIEVSNPVIPNGASSISFWYNPEGSTGTEYILGQGIATASKGITVYWYNQSFGALVAKGTSSLAGSATGSTTYSTTTWHNVVFTWDGTSSSNAFKVYVNGSLLVEGTSDTSSSSIGTYTNFAIGGLQGGTFASGSIDQVRIYDTALSSTDVSNIYTNEVQANSGGGSAAESSLTLTAGVAYDVTVGAGGADTYSSGGSSANGASSIFSTITSVGGGGAGATSGGASAASGKNGGSGGGAGSNTSGSPGNGTLGQGYIGGTALFYGGSYAGGGGGGALSPGGNSASSTVAGNGGSQLNLAITGTSIGYAGGGGGSLYGTGTVGTNDSSGGAAAPSSSSSVSGESAPFNLGGGGGGANHITGTTNIFGGSGGSGVVILRYPTASVSSFTTTGTLNTPSTTDTVADNNYPTTNTAYYKLDGNATDSSGNGYNGAASNVTWQNGRFNQAAVFNGSSSIIKDVLGSGFTYAGKTMTFSAWIFVTDNTNDNMIIGDGLATSTGGWGISTGYGNAPNTRLSFSVASSAMGGVQQTYSSVSVADNTWTHIVVSVDFSSVTDSVKMYFNGTEDTSLVDGISGSFADNTTYNTSIGGTWTGSAGRLFEGSIDQVRIFSTALSSSQVTELYNEHYQTKFTDGSDTAIVFTEGTGTVTFSGVEPTPPNGAIRYNTTTATIEFYNGGWVEAATS